MPWPRVHVPFSSRPPSRAVFAGGGDEAGALLTGPRRSCCGEAERGAVSLPRREGACASARGAELLFPLSFPCGGTVQELGGRAPPCPRPGSGSAAVPGAPGSGP